MINCYAKKSLLGRYKLLKFIQEALKWLNRPVSIKDSWKIVLKKNVSEGFEGKFRKMLR